LIDQLQKKRRSDATHRMFLRELESKFLLICFVEGAVYIAP
jgi:hypothetical protein